jgi:radical SAM superfamily enzyme YgiQ (UPF0313 family)
MDVLFTHSYFLRFDPKEYRAMMPYPPLGTLYAASVARDLGFSVALFDSMLAGSPDELDLATTRPRVLAIYDDDFNYLTKMCLTNMRDAAFTMVEKGRAAGCTVVVHGSDAADHAEEYLGRGADYVIVGEGEQTLGELLRHLLRGEGSREDIAGLVFTRDDGIHRTSRRRVQKDLDRLPFPARDLVDIDRYRTVWKRRHGFFSLNLVTTRGCPFHCNWCAKPIYGQVYNARSPGNVADEMEDLRRRFHPDHLWFCDDIFGLASGWVGSFAEEITRRHLSIPFKCLGRADLLVKGDTIPQLRRAGCKTVWIGAESGSQKILDAMEKGTTVDQIRTATRNMKNAGIRVGFFLQYGYPGETRGDIDKTLALVRECRPDEIGVSVSYPLPGTPFHERVRAEMAGKQNWTDSQDLALMYRGSFAPDFYRILHRVTHKHFRIWESEAIAGRLIRRPWELTPAMARRLGASVYHRLTLPPLERQLESLS